MSESDGGTDDPSLFHERLDSAAAALEAAETETDLDAIDEQLQSIATDLEGATLPEPPAPDEDGEKVPDPRETLEDRLSELEDGVEAERGPYAGDVIDRIDTASTTVESTEWAEEGTHEVHEAIESFLDVIETSLSGSIDRPDAPDPTDWIGPLDVALDLIDSAALDPDEDRETIATLLDGVDDLISGLEEATAFGDLPVREQLNRRGFFEPLGHYKDFPPEWSAIKAHEEAGNVEMILLAFDLLGSEYMEAHCIDAFRRLADERTIDPMMTLAQRRDVRAIEVLGKIGSDEPIDMLLEYIETESDPRLQQFSLRSLGEIGSTDTTEAVAQQLAADVEIVRSTAARSLGMIGDPRAIEPLATILTDADEAEPVRGSAAWALLEIGTADALEVVAEHAEDASYLVEVEAAKLDTVDRPV